VYVHAKVCVIDDTWAIVGSDNFNRRSWTHDSELSCAVLDQPGDVVRQGPGSYAHALRTALGREHLGGGADGELDGARDAFEAFRRGPGRLADCAATASRPCPPGRGLGRGCPTG
jgi:phosphatidylserine/phosphatidylglycerophosphate/cardiolipin synthase-like enzyme